MGTSYSTVPMTKGLTVINSTLATVAAADHTIQNLITFTVAQHQIVPIFAIDKIKFITQLILIV